MPRTNARHRIRAAVAVGAALTLSGCWLQPGSTADNTGYNPTESTLTAANVGSLTETFSLGLSNPVAPVVGPDGLITADTLDVDGSQDLVSLDPASGAVQWRTAIGGTIGTGTGDPLLDIGAHHVRVSAGQMTGYGALWDPATTLDTRTGAIVNRGAENPGDSKLLSTTGGTDLYWNPDDPYSPCEGCGHAYQTWAWIPGHSLDGPVAASAISVGTPTLGDHLVWLPSVTGQGAVVEAYGWDALCSNSCSPLWQRPVNGAATRPVHDAKRGTIYVGTHAGTAYALDGKTGAVRWSMALLAGPISASPAFDGSHLYVVTDSGTLVVVDAATGAIVGRSNATTAAWTSPVVAGGVVYVGTSSGTVRAYNTSCSGTGCAPIWSGTVDGPPTSLVVDDGHLYVTTYDSITAFAPAG